MTYFAGMGSRVGALVGALVGAIQLPTAPHIRCDGCGMLKLGETKRGHMTAWLRNNTAPPGWLLLRHENELVLYRRDYCQSCRSVVKETP